MGVSRLNRAERLLQPRFSLSRLIRPLLLLCGSLLLAGDSSWDRPDRTPRPERSVAVRYIPLPLPPASDGKLTLTGLWRLEMTDPRLGGVSGLAVNGARLLAVTDSGSVLDLPRPGQGTMAIVRDLPDGPGSRFWKKYRDSESIARDPLGRGWWVGFEFQHSLYLYDLEFRRALRRIGFAEDRWPPNKSLEAIVPAGPGLLVIPETGREVLQIEEGRIATQALVGATGAPADAVRLPDGRVMVLLRSVRPWGLRNELAELVRSGAGYRLRPLGQLPLGPLDNAEGISVEQRPDGQVRLWVVTDNDFSGRRPTLLMAVDLPFAAQD